MLPPKLYLLQRLLTYHVELNDDTFKSEGLSYVTRHAGVTGITDQLILTRSPIMTSNCVTTEQQFGFRVGKCGSVGRLPAVVTC